jgi:DNA-binding transcriptional LysR family regulator
MLHVTFRQLRVFEAVARHLSYSRAAEELYLSQPAVSMQIRQLEESVGLPLFEQLGKKVYLTEAGREMFRYSREISRQLVEAENVLQELKGMKRGKLVISMVSNANYFIPRLLSVFCQQLPDVTVNLDVANREKLLRQLADNEMDLGIMGQPPEEAELLAEPFLDNPLVVIASPTHPLVAERHIPVERLGGETFLVRERGSGTRMAMERIFTQHGIKPPSGMEMSTTEAIKQSVQAGMGLAVVSLHTIELELETGRLAVLDVEDFPIRRHWYVVYRKGKRLSAVAQAFKDFLVKEAARVMGQKAAT